MVQWLAGQGIQRKRFEGDLARNAVADATGSYSPYWYRGGDWSTSGNSGDFSKSFSSIAR